MSILDLVRPDLRGFSGYLSARKQNSNGAIWLNANESPSQHSFDNLGLNRYPEPQPKALKTAMSAYYGVDENAMLITRGSDEAIDLLIRAICVPGLDSIAIQSPTFGMYAVCARLHACKVIDVVLQTVTPSFSWHIDAMIDSALTEKCKIMFLCSPANPTGQAIATDDLIKLLDALSGQCLVVVDEAYGEYSDTPSASILLAKYSHLAVLKTLSKAHALAGARIGCVIASTELISVLKTCQAPYPIAKPSAELALQAFLPKPLAQTQKQITVTIAQRDWLAERLKALVGVEMVFTSQANFLLVRFKQSEQVYQDLLQRGMVVRSMSQYPAISNCLRISIGTEAENQQLLNALTELNESISTS